MSHVTYTIESFHIKDLVNPIIVRCNVLQCVAVCCSVLHCVALCCSLLQCVAVCCSVLQCVAECCTLGINSRPYESSCSALQLQCIAVCCSALQCVAAHCSVFMSHRRPRKSSCSALQLQSVAERPRFCNVLQRDLANQGAVRCSVVQCVAVCCSVFMSQTGPLESSQPCREWSALLRKESHVTSLNGSCHTNK